MSAIPFASWHQIDSAGNDGAKYDNAADDDSESEHEYCLS